MAKYILFDVDGVIVNAYDTTPCKKVLWVNDLEKDIGISDQDLDEAFFKKDFVDNVIVGKKDLYQSLSEVLPTIGFNKDPQILIDYWLDKDSDLNSELLGFLKALANVQGVYLYLATNQEKNRAQYLMNQLGLKDIFHGIFYSGDLGVMKPDPLYFQKVQERLDVEPDDIIFFDDSLQNVKMAKNLGWQAYHFDKTDDIFQSSIISNFLRPERRVS